MQDTGIVRRIDELGRFVVPKELRRKLKIKEGDAIEIYTNENQMILRKYSPMSQINALAKSVADGIYGVLEKGVIITDNDAVVACSGIKELSVGEEITLGAQKAIKERKNLIISRNDGGTVIPVVKNFNYEINNQVLVPLIAGGDCYGAIVLVDSDKYYRFTMQEVKLARVGASVLASQLED